MTVKEAKEKYGESSGINNKTVFADWEAIENLPDTLQPVWTEITFNPNDLDEYFANVGTKIKPSWFPCAEMVKQIAKAVDVQGENYRQVKRITEEVDYNPIFLIDDGPDVKPCMRIIETKIEVSIIASIIELDGSRRLSPPTSGVFDFWSRLMEEFAKEEGATNYYTNENYKKGEKWKFKDNKYKRKQRYYELRKFAESQAETRAFGRAVRLLVGLPTGFSPQDLKTGKLVFCRYVKSDLYLKAESAARIEGIRNGNTKQIQDMSNRLFGPEKIEAPGINPAGPEDNYSPPTGAITGEDLPDNSNNLMKTVNSSESEKMRNKIKQYYNKYHDILDKVTGAKDSILSVNESTPMKVLKSIITRIEKRQGIEKIIDESPEYEEEDLF